MRNSKGFFIEYVACLNCMFRTKPFINMINPIQEANTFRVIATGTALFKKHLMNMEESTNKGQKLKKNM